MRRVRQTVLKRYCTQEFFLKPIYYIVKLELVSMVFLMEVKRKVYFRADSLKILLKCYFSSPTMPPLNKIIGNKNILK